MKVSAILLASAIAWLTSTSAWAATPEQPDEPRAGESVAQEVWTIAGGELKLRFNEDFLDLFGIRVDGAEPAPGQPFEDVDYAVFRVHSDQTLQINAPEGGFDRFVGGTLRTEGGFSLALADGRRIAFDRMQLRASRINGAELELVGNDGRAWLYVNHLMYKMVDDHQAFYVRSADLRASQALAELAGSPELANAYIGELRMLALVTARPAGFQPPSLNAQFCARFHNEVHNGITMQADVLMETYSMSFSRCRRGDTGANGCDGAGPDDGEVVFTPSSTLRNTAHQNSADVPWYRKFTTSKYPYPYPGNDQHPYLIWNVLRVVDGQLEQIGASGLKHAFLTINSGCAQGSCRHGNLLGQGCGDVYGTGNNDSSSDLGPRQELVPSTGYWGRCGSIYDTNCDGSPNNSGNTQYDQRLVVRESQMQVPGAQFFSESWYIVQDDVNIYNTMAYRPMAPAPGGSGWTPGSQGAFTQGALINHWVDPVANPTRNVEIVADGGHTRIAVKVKTLDACPAGSGLSGTCYRYDYAVNNFDFTRPVYGEPPNHQPPNLRLLSNNGFNSVRIPVPAGNVHLGDNHFADIDINPANNWSAVVAGNAVTWTAPEGNELNWGHLYRFSLVSNLAPQDNNVGEVRLGVAGPGTPSTLQASMMVPVAGGTPTQYTVTATAGAGGSIAPPSQTVVSGGNAQFTVTPNGGFQVASVTGNTCTPVNNGNGTWTASNITANCAVTASFSAIPPPQYTVTATAGAGGSIAPPSQVVVSGGNAQFTVTANSGFQVASVTGSTCTPVNNGNGTWTASNITANCAVTASFSAIPPPQYTVTATAGAGGSIAPPSQLVVSGGNAQFTVTANSGFHVGVVSGDTCKPMNVGNGIWIAHGINANCAVIATFTETPPQQYTVTATAGEGGSISPPSQIVNAGGDAQFTVSADNGFEVASVSGNVCTPVANGNDSWTAEDITADCAVVASFSETDDLIFADGFEQKN